MNVKYPANEGEKKKISVCIVTHHWKEQKTKKNYDSNKVLKQNERFPSKTADVHDKKDL